MTALRIFSFSMHAALELMVGLALIFAPLVLGLSLVGAAVAIVLGALLCGLALEAAGEPGALRMTDHHAFDQTAVATLVGAALPLGLSGDRSAALLLVGSGIAQLALTLTTRYSGRH